MPWKEETTMSNRVSFVADAKKENANISETCRRYGISRKTGYKWIKREKEEGEIGLKDRSRRPNRSPNQTSSEMEKKVLDIRKKHPKWGGRKIRRILINHNLSGVPSASTITAILQRNGKIDPEESAKHTAWQHFERKKPNELWQMDFKGYFPMTSGENCHPLTVLDDHSRFLLGLKACSNETSETVKTQLTAIFEQFGLPDSMLMDNGPQWKETYPGRPSALLIWLMRLGISILHGRPYHPQTQGKDERLHRTLNDEVISQYKISNLIECQKIFCDWQYIYNFVRPHEALNFETPHTRFTSSPRTFPKRLPPIVYEPNDTIRKVDSSGKIYFRNLRFRVGRGYRSLPVAIRPTEVDGVLNVFFCTTKIKTIDLHRVEC